MVLNNHQTVSLTRLLAIAFCVSGLALIGPSCTVDSVERPAPRIDLLYNGSVPSDTIVLVVSTTVNLHVRYFAPAGLKSCEITNADGSEVSSTAYKDTGVVTCDSLLPSFSFAGSSAVTQSVKIEVKDWQDQSTEKWLTMVYTPGGSVVVRPVIVSIVQPAYATEGGTATFTVIASGSNLRYQWQKNAVAIVGATTNSYTTPATTLADNGASFRCIVSNTAGKDTSNAAILTVTAASTAKTTVFNWKTIHADSVSQSHDAQIAYSQCVLTPAAAFKSGSCFYPKQVDLSKGFETTFSFIIAQKGGVNDSLGDNGGDGMAFVICDDQWQTKAGTLNGLGYDSLSSSVIVEIDEYYNEGVGDSTSNHIGIMKNGSRDHALGWGSRSTGLPTFDDGGLHTMRITWDTDYLRVYVDENDIPAITATISTGSSLLNGQGYIGFTAVGYAAYESHTVAGWSFSTY